MGNWHGVTALGAGAYPTAGQLEVYSDFIANAVDIFPRAKATNEFRNNTTTLENDDDLFWEVVAGSYNFLINNFYTAGTVPDVKFGWSYPSGTTIKWGGLSSDTAGAITILGNRSESQTMIAAGSGTDLFCQFVGQVTVTTDGTLNYQWAQNALEASNTTLYAGTHAYLIRIA